MDLWLGLGAHFSSRAVLSGLLVLTAWHGKVIFKARKGQEPSHSRCALPPGWQEERLGSE